MDRPLSAASRPSDFVMDREISSRCRPARPCELLIRGYLCQAPRELMLRRQHCLRGWLSMPVNHSSCLQPLLWISNIPVNLQLASFAVPRAL